MDAKKVIETNRLFGSYKKAVMAVQAKAHSRLSKPPQQAVFSTKREDISSGDFHGFSESDAVRPPSGRTRKMFKP